MVSIHAPTRGATCSLRCIGVNLSVSIHAPTRGATAKRNKFCCECLFQSTHPHGVRRGHERRARPRRLFQSTHPHGVRRGIQSGAETSQTFQSTHPHGVRQFLCPILRLFFLFQSTHPHGVRLLQTHLCFHLQSFNPRTHTGCDYEPAK